MRPHSSSAYLTSLILHGFVAALIAITTVFVARQEEMPKIIELVAGPPTDMNSLEAPAEGVPNPIKMTVPKVTLPPQPEPETHQVEETPSEPEPVTKPVAKPVAKPEPVKTPPVTKAKSDLSITQKVKQSQKTSYRDFLKKNPIKKQSVASAVRESRVPRVDTQGIVNGVKGGSTTSKGGQGGKAMTREVANQLDIYISFLKQELKKAHEPPPGVSDQLVTRIEFDVTSSGAILNPRIVKSSGNREFDESVLDAFRRMRPIGPTPDRRAHNWTMNFEMREDS